jgi:hypothetical protein
VNGILKEILEHEVSPTLAFKLETLEGIGIKDPGSTLYFFGACNLGIFCAFEINARKTTSSVKIFFMFV